ncbi:MAG TPA: hypothetical protein ENI95_08250 [Chloroflexi bacterium]|nr:hypothetical protein [Chloroflexota bacterium]
MTDFFQRVTEEQGSLEELARKLPGFKGYFAKQDRRAADRLLREHLVRVFEEQLGEFTRLQKQLIDSGGIMYMERVQGIDTKLRTFIDRIESAAQGYAGIFDAVKIREDALDRVYAFDHALLAYKDQLVEGLRQLSEAIGTEEVGSVLTQLDALVTEANNTFKRRVEAMRGLQESV